MPLSDFAHSAKKSATIIAIEQIGKRIFVNISNFIGVFKGCKLNIKNFPLINFSKNSANTLLVYQFYKKLANFLYSIDLCV